MAISFVAAGTVASGTNPTVTLPAGTAPGDLLVIVTAGSAASSVDTVNFYPGWTRIANQGAGQFICVHTKIADGTDGSVVLTQTGTTSRAVMLAYRGCGWYDVLATFTTATATSIATATQTTGFANDYVTSIYAVTNAARTWTAPASTTTRVNAAGTATLRGLLVVDELQAAAGVTTARTATIPTSSTLSAVSISIREPQTCYWVGGPGTWDSVTKTNWATSSGGTGNRIVPGDDNVVFDANSNVGTTAFTVTLSTTDWARCDNFTTSGLDASMTLAGGTNNNYALIAYGDITFPATNLAFSGTSGDIFLTPIGSKTLSTNGITVGFELQKRGSGTTVLGSALTVSGSITLRDGTFSTSALNNFSVTVSGGQFRSLATEATLSLNASTVTLIGNATWNFGTPGELTFNPGTSLITFGTTTGDFQGGGLTYYDVSLRPGSTNTQILGNNTFRNLTFQSISNKNYVVLPQGSTQTVTGTFTANGSSAANRIFVTVSADPPLVGAVTQATINTAAVSLSNVDFYGIASAGAAGTWSGTSIGNVGLNTGITFTAAKTVFLPSAANGNLSTTAWANTQGGAGNSANYPLPQDTATITNSSGTSGLVVSGGEGVWEPLYDGSPRTDAATFEFNGGNYSGGLKFGSGFLVVGVNGGSLVVGGDFSVATGVTFDGEQVYSSVTFVPTRSTTLTIQTNNVGLNNFSQSFAFSGNINSSTIAISTTFNANNRAATFANTNLDLSAGGITVLSFTSTSTNTKSITFGTNSITTRGDSVAINVVGTGLTISGTGGFNLNNTGASGTTATLSTGFTESNAPNLSVTGGSYALTLTTPILKNLSFSSFTGSVSNVARTIYGSFTISGTNPSFIAGVLATTFAGSGSNTLTTNGATITFPIIFNGVGGSWQLGSALTMSSDRSLTLTRGTFDAATYNVTIGLFTAAGTNTRTLSMGSGSWSLTGGTATVWDLNNTSGLTFNKDTANIAISSNTNSVTRTFAGGGLTYNALNISGGAATGQITQLTGSNTFSSINSTKTVGYTLRFTGGTTTTVTDFNITGTGISGGVTLSVGGGSGQWNIAKAGGGIVENIDNLVIFNSNATPGGTWYAGANSTDFGSNTGWIFANYPGPNTSNFFLLF